MDEDRYKTAAGWDPIAAARKKAKDPLADITPTAFYHQSANEPVNFTGIGDRLFGNLWNVGDLAVMFGPPGVGKSLFAVQIAESIARGLDDPAREFTTLEPRRVIYLDLHRTHAQFRRLYGGYRFAETLERAELDTSVVEPPAAFRNFGEYVFHWFSDLIAFGGPSVVFIVDTANYLTSASIRAEALMRHIRRVMAESRVSVLLIANSRPRKRPQPVTLNDLPAASQPFAAHADSVFAIAASTMHPGCRYLKHLKSRTEPLGVPLASADVHTFRIFQTELPWGADPEPDAGIVCSIHQLAAAPARLSIANAFATEALEARNAPHQIEGDFPGFLYLGLTAESQHLRDHAAEAERPQPKQVNKKTTITDILTSREYHRYLQR